MELHLMLIFTISLVLGYCFGKSVMEYIIKKANEKTSLTGGR